MVTDNVRPPDQRDEKRRRRPEQQGASSEEKLILDADRFTGQHLRPRDQNWNLTPSLTLDGNWNIVPAR